MGLRSPRVKDNLPSRECKVKPTRYICALLSVLVAFACGEETPTSIETEGLSSSGPAEAAAPNDGEELARSPSIPSTPSLRKGSHSAETQRVTGRLTMNSGAFPPGSGGGVGTNEMCTEETCTGSGGGGSAGSGYGYALGFTFIECRNRGVSIDTDGDDVDDECERMIAETFAPELVFSSGDNAAGRETYWAAHWRYSCGDYHPDVGYGGEPIGVCDWHTPVIRVMYLPRILHRGVSFGDEKTVQVP